MQAGLLLYFKQTCVDHVILVILTSITASTGQGQGHYGDVIKFLSLNPAEIEFFGLQKCLHSNYGPDTIVGTVIIPSMSNCWKVGLEPPRSCGCVA